MKEHHLNLQPKYIKKVNVITPKPQPKLDNQDNFELEEFSTEHMRKNIHRFKHHLQRAKQSKELAIKQQNIVHQQNLDPSVQPLNPQVTFDRRNPLQKKIEELQQEAKKAFKHPPKSPKPIVDYAKPLTPVSTHNPLLSHKLKVNPQPSVVQQKNYELNSGTTRTMVTELTIR